MKNISQLQIPHTRRSFLKVSALAAGVGLATGAAGCSHLNNKGPTHACVAFVTANLVARVSGYRFELAHWGISINRPSPRRTRRRGRPFFREIRAAGFRAIEMWEAHAAPEVMTRERGAAWKAIMDDHGLRAIGHGGGLSRKTLEIFQWLGIPQVNGWIGDHTPEQATVLCREMGVRFNVENHPQKSAEEILNVVDGGNEWLGVTMTRFSSCKAPVRRVANRCVATSRESPRFAGHRPRLRRQSDSRRPGNIDSAAGTGIQPTRMGGIYSSNQAAPIG